MKKPAREFEDKYGILKLVASQHPADEPINPIVRRFRNFLGQNSGKKGNKADNALRATSDIESIAKNK